ncbi:MAG: sodium-translocating pyrophosphatase [Acidimicrobiales bacterium]
MTHLLAAEGGYQSFVLSGTEKTWLVVALAAAVFGIGVGLVLMRGVLKADTGTDSMRAIAAAIQEGAVAFLRRQFRAILIVLVPLAVLIFFTATKVVRPADHSVALSFASAGGFRVLCFLFGAACSGLTGFIGMSLAVRGNVRTAAAARDGKLGGALRVAFRTGAITGMLCVGLGLLGATVIVFTFQNTATAVLVGFGFGASLLALFMRVGGGIFTKAADVGADLVGKVEAGIPEDDPRNAATIADNVGDNVGDCAGMAADLFESYVITIIAAIILGFSAFNSLGPSFIAHSARAVVFPIIIPAAGIVASAVGVFVVRARDKDRSAMAPINRGFWTAAALTLVAAGLVAAFYLHYMKAFYAVLVGVILSLVASQITEHFTSTERNPVREIAESARTGPATTTLAGIAIGLESTVWAIIAIAVAIGVNVGMANGNIELTLYLISLTGIGLLSTAGMVVSEDSFGPVSDNAAGVAEMSGEFSGEAERIMVSLDAVGNTTKAITKGVAIGSAVIAAVSLFGSFVETISSQLNLHIPAGKTLFDLPATQINVSNPKIFIGLLIGGSVAFLFSSLAIRAVGRSAGTVVHEVRRQFREHPGIMDYTEKPEYGRVIAICTAAAQRELVTPALLAILTPVIVGFGISYLALGAFLAAAILTGQLMANFLSNSGGAWDNAKKYIEDGHEGGKGSEAHKAAVIGDTIGDPFKDTAGPALNPLIKVMNLVSLLILPVVITQQHHTGVRYGIAGGALVVLLISIAFSKRKSEGFGAEEEGVKGQLSEAPAAVATGA